MEIEIEDVIPQKEEEITKDVEENVMDEDVEEKEVVVEDVKVEKESDDNDNEKDEKEEKINDTPTPTPTTPTKAAEKEETNNNNVKQAVNIVHSSITLHDDAKLIQVTGKDEPFHFITIPLSTEFLNLEDVFIMQSDAYIFVWCSDKVNIKKKAKAVQMAQKLKVEIGCQRAVQVLEIGEEHPTFLFCLGLPKGNKLNVTKENNDIFQIDDEEGETPGEVLEPEFFLYKLSTGADGKPSIKPMESEEEGGGINQEMLESNSCFILDCEHEMYIWQGKGVKKSTKETLIPLAKKIWTQYDRPEYYSKLKIQPIITMVFDGAESCLFKSKFGKWIEKAQPLQTSYLSLSQKKKDALSFDVASMHEEKEIPTINIGAASDYGNGKLLVWSSTTTGNKWSKVEEDDFGIFYSNKCYVCHFIYKPENKNSIRSVIFYWEGLYANQRNYIGYKFGLYKEIQKKMQSLQSDDPVEHRISQNKEPIEFINLFGTELLVLNEELSMKPMIFQVRGIRGTQLYPDQDACNARLLNSLDSFVFLFPNKYIIVWHGSLSTQAQRALAADLFTFLPPEYEAIVKEFDQGGESENFWKLIGGGESDVTINTYSIENEDDDVNEQPKQERPAKIKFFLCTENSGIFKADQINPFSQVDLNTEECVLFDVYHKLFLWKGAKSSEQKLKDSKDLAEKYLETANDKRPSSCSVELIEQYNETPLFKSYFNSWKVTAPKVFIDPIISYKQKLNERLQKEKEDLEKLKQQQEEKEQQIDSSNNTTTASKSFDETTTIETTTTSVSPTKEIKEEIKEEVKQEDEAPSISQENTNKDEQSINEIKQDQVSEEISTTANVIQEETEQQQEQKEQEIQLSNINTEDNDDSCKQGDISEENIKQDEKVDEAENTNDTTITATTTTTTTTTTTESISPIITTSSDSEETKVVSNKDKRKSHEPIGPTVISSSGDMLFAFDNIVAPHHSPKLSRKGGKKAQIKNQHKKNHSVDSSPTILHHLPKSLNNDIIDLNDGAVTTDDLDGANSKSPLSNSTSAISNSNSVHNTPKKNNKNKNKKKHNRSSSLTHT